MIGETQPPGIKWVILSFTLKFNMFITSCYYYLFYRIKLSMILNRDGTKIWA